MSGREEYTVYGYWSLAGKCWAYIGCTRRPYKRHQEHTNICNNHAGGPCWKHMGRYPEELFEYRVICEGLAREEAEAIERSKIKAYGKTLDNVTTTHTPLPAVHRS